MRPAGQVRDGTFQLLSKWAPSFLNIWLIGPQRLQRVPQWILVSQAPPPLGVIYLVEAQVESLYKFIETGKYEPTETF